MLRFFLEIIFFKIKSLDMKNLKSILAASILTVSLFSISAFTTTSKIKDGNAHANGGGTTIEGGKVSTFVFNAVELPDGSVQGHLNYQFRFGDVNIKMDLDCMSITGNRATLSGVVTEVGGKGTPPNYIFVGQRASFTVEDNGQGKNASPDMISDLILFGGASCANNWPTYLPISGNIDIKE
jgi:hypothetical protein